MRPPKLADGEPVGYRSGDPPAQGPFGRFQKRMATSAQITAAATASAPATLPARPRAAKATAIGA